MKHKKHAKTSAVRHVSPPRRAPDRGRRGKSAPAKPTPPAPAGSASIEHNVFIVDDHPLVCEAISGLINQQTDLTVCGSAGEYRAAMQSIDAACPEIVVVDISLGGKSGIDLIKDLKAVHPKILTIVFSMHDESLYARVRSRPGPGAIS